MDLNNGNILFESIFAEENLTFAAAATFETPANPSAADEHDSLAVGVPFLGVPTAANVIRKRKKPRERALSKEVSMERKEQRKDKKNKREKVRRGQCLSILLFAASIVVVVVVVVVVIIARRPRDAAAERHVDRAPTFGD